MADLNKIGNRPYAVISELSPAWYYVIRHEPSGDTPCVKLESGERREEIDNMTMLAYISLWYINNVCLIMGVSSRDDGKCPFWLDARRK